MVNLHAQCRATLGEWLIIWSGMSKEKDMDHANVVDNALTCKCQQVITNCTYIFSSLLNALEYFGDPLALLTLLESLQESERRTNCMASAISLL